ncbi:MFS transporter [Nocardioides sp. CER19]|uniref:MFS transporter n=1 Tax=Nocardioides sp. CER19 TaxID=3038538 RepID=UPI0024483488|nr:MFS transporter [Nocardioides sp. CER19]MDH2416104.1 MFS transporter [Nocardioides sp. CER19]
MANTIVVQAVTFVVRPSATYRALELGVGAQWLGLMSASFAIVPLLVAVQLGRTVDRIGERRVMVTGAVLATAAGAVLVFLGDYVWGLLVGFILLGTGHLGSVVAQQALVANRTDASRYDSVFGRYTFAASLGQAIGPGLIIVSGRSQAIPHTHTIFVWATLLSLTLIATAAAVPSQERPMGAAERREGSVASLLRRRELVLALTVSCVVQAAVDITVVYLPALGSERSVAAGTVGALLTVRAVASMGSRLFLGRLVDLLGRARLLTTSVSVAAVTMAALAFVSSTPTLFLLVLGMGFGLGCGQPLTMSWLAESSPPGLRGRAMSLRLTGNRLGQVVLPSAAGVLAIGSGAGAVLCATGVSLAAVAVLSRSIGSPGQAPTTPTT